MADENSLNFVHIIHETCLMKCKNSIGISVVLLALKAKGQKLLNAPRMYPFNYASS